MKRSYPRILFAAPSSKSGKTTLVCGLLKAVLERGMTCASFKCGPDYIDPMFHTHVLGLPGSNLDSYFLEEQDLKALFCRRAKDAALSIIEGVMGYYDGLAGISTRASTYEVGMMLECPVVLVMDCKSCSLSVAAVIKGFLDYGKGHQIRGVILNRVSEGMALRLREPIEELGVEFLGYVPLLEEISLESRHLGLVMPDEIEGLTKKLADMAGIFEKSVNIDRIIEIAKEASWMEEFYADNHVPKTLKIGVAKDEAFCFYYRENLELLERLGAELIFFSPIHDKEMPGDLNGILLGGGYPEIWAKELSFNTVLRQQLLQMLRDGMPLLAECGGFLYLHKRLQGADGNWYPMTGYFDADAYKTDKLLRFGYIQLERKEDVTGNGGIKAHEFHYWESERPGEDYIAEKPLSNRKWSCIHERPGQIAGFPHLYYLSNPGVIKEWLSLCTMRRLSYIPQKHYTENTRPRS